MKSSTSSVTPLSKWSHTAIRGEKQTCLALCFFTPASNITGKHMTPNTDGQLINHRKLSFARKIASTSELLGNHTNESCNDLPIDQRNSEAQARSNVEMLSNQKEAGIRGYIDEGMSEYLILGGDKGSLMFYDTRYIINNKVSK